MLITTKKRKLTRKIKNFGGNLHTFQCSFWHFSEGHLFRKKDNYLFNEDLRHGSHFPLNYARESILQVQFWKRLNLRKKSSIARTFVFTTFEVWAENRNTSRNLNWTNGKLLQKVFQICDYAFRWLSKTAVDRWGCNEFCGWNRLVPEDQEYASSFQVQSVFCH